MTASIWFSVIIVKLYKIRAMKDLCNGHRKEFVKEFVFIIQSFKQVLTIQEFLEKIFPYCIKVLKSLKLHSIKIEVLIFNITYCSVL